MRTQDIRTRYTYNKFPSARDYGEYAKNSDEFFEQPSYPVRVSIHGRGLRRKTVKQMQGID
jgi:hypothetical protein